MNVYSFSLIKWLVPKSIAFCFFNVPFSSEYFEDPISAHRRNSISVVSNYQATCYKENSEMLLIMFLYGFRRHYRNHTKIKTKQNMYQCYFCSLVKFYIISVVLSPEPVLYGWSQGIQFVSQSLVRISEVILSTSMELLLNTLVCLLIRQNYCHVKKPLTGCWDPIATHQKILEPGTIQKEGVY